MKFTVRKRQVNVCLKNHHFYISLPNSVSGTTESVLDRAGTEIATKLSPIQRTWLVPTGRYEIRVIPWSCSLAIYQVSHSIVFVGAIERPQLTRLFVHYPQMGIKECKLSGAIKTYLDLLPTPTEPTNLFMLVAEFLRCAGAPKKNSTPREVARQVLGLVAVLLKDR